MALFLFNGCESISQKALAWEQPKIHLLTCTYSLERGSKSGETRVDAGIMILSVIIVLVSQGLTDNKMNSLFDEDYLLPGPVWCSSD